MLTMLFVSEPPVGAKIKLIVIKLCVFVWKRGIKTIFKPPHSLNVTWNMNGVTKQNVLENEWSTSSSHMIWGWTKKKCDRWWSFVSMVLYR